ncbi:MAG: glycosyltransferase [bacterium]
MLKKARRPDGKTQTPQTLGGSMFIRNAIQFDYCVCEALASLCKLCDKVVIVDASSTDGTLEMLQEFQKSHSNLKIVSGENWECHEKYDRLRILADIAKSHLDTDWHFMLQADEVIHEKSFKTIKEAIKSTHYDSYLVRRMNLFGDLNHYLRYDIPHGDKPVSDSVIRLSKIQYNAYGDAESLQTDPATCCTHLLDKILVVHYGFVRRDKNNLDKTISMQSWFWGQGSQPDHRVVEMAKNGTRYEWELLKSRELLARIPMEHPKFVKQWAEERQAEKTPV